MKERRRTTRIVRTLAAAFCASVALTACSGGTPTTGPAVTDSDPVLRITATVSPIADLITQVGGERVHVRSLVPPGADAHSYAPRPRDAMRLEEADLFIGVGLGLNDVAVRLARTNLQPDARLVLLGEEVLDPAVLVYDHPLGSRTDLPVDASGLGPNPHVWTSFRNLRAMVAGIVTVLSEADPEGAEHHAARGALLDAAIADLTARVDAAIATIAPEDRVLVTYHDAWAYFARDHGLVYAIAVQGGDYSDPSAAGVRALVDQVRGLGVRAVFGSRVFPSSVLEVIATESGATYVPGLSDDVLPGEPGDAEHNVLELMRRNAVIIIEGLGGDASALATPIARLG